MQTPLARVPVRRPAAGARPRPMEVAAPPVPTTSIARQRGYRGEDLMAIAEIGHHYLSSAGLDTALAIFRGLAAIAPEEPYFALALAFTLDRAGDEAAAAAAYCRAAQLDATDPLPELNRAELLLDQGRSAEALELLGVARDKARRRGEPELERKAAAIAAHLRATARGGQHA